MHNIACCLRMREPASQCKEPHEGELQVHVCTTSAMSPIKANRQTLGNGLACIVHVSSRLIEKLRALHVA